jgi:hypothetical protein
MDTLCVTHRKIGERLEIRIGVATVAAEAYEVIERDEDGILHTTTPGGGTRCASRIGWHCCVRSGLC